MRSLSSNHKRARIFLFRLFLISVFLLAATAVSVAQNDFYTPLGLKPGTPAGSYTLTDIDSVNLFNGRVNVRIGSIPRAGRGDTKTEMAFTKDSPTRFQVYKSSDPYGNPIWGTGYAGPSNPDAMYSGQGEITVYPQGVGTGAQNWCSEGLYTWGEKTLTRFFWVEPDGTEHEMRDVLTNGQPLQSGGCWSQGPNRGRVFASTDGSGATYITDVAVHDGIYVNWEYPAGTDWSGWLFLKDGRKIRISWDSNRGLRDRNGNLLSTNLAPATPFILDNLKRTTGTGTGTSAECSALVPGATSCGYSSYKGFNGTERRLYGFADENFRTTRMFLPNGQGYRFYYNNYDDLIRIDLPTGGSIEYDYEPGLTGPQPNFSFISGFMPGTYSDTSDNGFHVYRRLTERRVYREGHVLETRQTFSKPEDVYLNNAGYVEKKEYDGNGHLLRTERHYFHGSAEHSFWIKPTEYPAWRDGLEYRTETYDGNGNLVRKTERTFEQRAPVSWWTGSSDTAPPNDPRLQQETNYLEDGTFTITTYGYDPTVPYNSQTDVYEREFNTYAVIRHTQTQYLKMLNGVDYSGSNIQNATDLHFRDFPVQVSIYDRDGIERGRTTYEYDNYITDTNHAPLVPRVNISGLDPAYTINYQRRANVTGITKYLLTNGTVTGSVSSYSQYDVAGNVVKTIDPRGCGTTINYDDAFGTPNAEARANTSPSELAAAGQKSFAFPTSVTNCKGHVTYTQYDFYVARLVDAEDVNGVVASAYFADPLDRLTQIIAAANQAAGVKAQNSFGYNDVTRTVTSTRDKTAYNDNVIKSETVYDGLGRVTESRQYEDATNFIAVRHVPYVVLQDGTNWFAATQESNPFRPYLGEQPQWTTTYRDSIARTVKLKTPDNAAITTTYNGRATTVIDQAGKKRKSVVDEFNRIAEVYEDPDGVNYLTSYAYNSLGNLVRVQQGSQFRYFMYDSLGRLIRARNPEQSTNASLNLSDYVTGNSEWSIGYEYDSNGNLTSRTDARGVVTQNVYDTLNRVTTVLYRVNGQPDPNTGDIEYLYDNATLGKGRLSLTYRWGAKPSHTSVGQYDAMGRVKQLWNLFGNGQGGWSAGYEVDRSYNLAGQITSQTYPSGHTVSFSYDTAGRTSSLAGNLGDGVTRTYASSFLYNARSQVTQELFGTQTPLYHKLQYNIRGQLWDVRVSTNPDVNGSMNRGGLQYFYDGSLGYGTSGPDNNGNVLFANTYTPEDEQDVHWAIHRQSYAYDSLNRLKSVTEYFINYSHPQSQQYVQTYDYDRWGNRTINAGQTSGTGINNKAFEVETGSNRLYSPGDLAPQLPEDQRRIRYDKAGNQIKDAYTGYGTATFDADNRIVAIQDKFAGSSTYTYNANAQRVRRRINNQETWQIYGIDGELVAEYAANSAVGTPQKEYGYRDQQLLITAETGSAQNVSWTNTAGVSVNGNSLTKTAATGWGNAGASSTQSIASGDGYVEVTATETTTARLFGFSHTDTDQNWPSINFGIDLDLSGLVYVFESGNNRGSFGPYAPGDKFQVAIVGGVVKYKKNGTVFYTSSLTPTYPLVVDTALHGNGCTLSNVVLSSATSAAAKVQWLVPDHLGTPRIILDQTGSIGNLRRHDYLPFGEELPAGTGGRIAAMGYVAGDGVRQKFTGYEADSETDLNYAQARYNSSLQGRFTSTDPVSGNVTDPQAWNMYSYVANNPMNLTDPRGMSYFIGSGANDPSIRENEYRVDGFDMSPSGTASSLTDESMLSYTPNWALLNEGSNVTPDSGGPVEIVIWDGTTNRGRDPSSAFGHVSYIINGFSYSWEAWVNPETGKQEWRRMDPVSYLNERRQLSAGTGYVLDLGSTARNTQFAKAIVNAYNGKGNYKFLTNNCGHAFQRAVNELKLSQVPYRLISPKQHEGFINNSLSEYIIQINNYSKGGHWN
jgi:RHS repeat-associated protein